MKKLIYLFLLITGTLYSQSPLCPSTSTNFCCEYVASITINGQTYAGNTGFSGPGYYDYTGTPVPTIEAGQIFKYHTLQLQMVITNNTLNYGLILTVMEI
jgi:hypothetical protein